MFYIVRFILILVTFQIAITQLTIRQPYENIKHRMQSTTLFIFNIGWLQNSILMELSEKSERNNSYAI